MELWNIMGTLSVFLFAIIGMKFHGCGAELAELGTKYNFEVIKYRSYGQIQPPAAENMV